MRLYKKLLTTRRSSRGDLHEVLVKTTLKLTNSEIQMFEDFADTFELTKRGLTGKNAQDRAEQVFNEEVYQ